MGFLVVMSVGAQGTSAPSAVLTGVVRTTAGAPVAGATVTVVAATAHQDRHTAFTRADGHFTLASVPPGPYTITVQLPGRPPTASSPINVTDARMVITVSDQNTLTIAAEQLAPAPVVPNTNPSATADTTGATGGEKLSSQSVSELPLNGRDFSTLLLLAAGTMTDVNGATNFTQQFAINGQRGVEAVFAMDGADISDPEMGGSTFTNFNVDAIQELQSSSGWMPAEIGQGAAGFTNIITRSGESGFHGSFFEFLRNSALDARNYFDHPSIGEPGRIPPFRRNEFGFTNGGPVLLPHLYNGRGRTFYFGEYQGFRQVLGTTQVLAVPTAAERAGQDTVAYPDGSTDTLQVPVNPQIAS
ncbi:MAG TPA: carboxypeptidase regulatory-like domain-containing protein, partial [Acidobacteriaceae bacterium]|nr:carboxypeptidase regulatory-like domain-containing protein [Acidobacteriaceae bacterium]